MMSFRATAWFALSFALPAAPALAAPEDCAAIATAFAKMGAAPAFREIIEQDGGSYEAVAVGDTLYMTMNGKTTKLPLGEAARTRMFSSLFDVLSVKDCSPLPDAAIDGKPMKVYRYVLPADGGLITTDMEQQVWISADDGLPYLSTSPGGRVTLSYDGVQAPAP